MSALHSARSPRLVIGRLQHGKIAAVKIVCATRSHQTVHIVGVSRTRRYFMAVAEKAAVSTRKRILSLD